MTTVPAEPAPMPEAAPDLGALPALLAQLRDLKRVRDARSPHSFMERLFARAWRRLVRGESAGAVAFSETAAAVAAVRLAGLDAGVLTAHGLSPAEAARALQRAFDDVAAPLDSALAGRLRETLGAAPTGRASSTASPAETQIPPDEPAFVAALIRQPRAGATHPGLPRLALEPAESHGDHSAAVAISGALLAPAFGADPARVFLLGLAHHLFNWTLPDAGHAADVLLGEAVTARLAAAATAAALDQLPSGLRGEVSGVLPLARAEHFGRPEARAFHAADVLDRVLEMAWHARAARFALPDALGRDTAAGQLDICHEGFYQAFQEQVLQQAGLWPGSSARYAAGPA